MHPRRIAAINAIFFFFFWLLVLFAGADFPPPSGFLILVIVIAACAAVIYWRVPTYIEWMRSQRSGRHWRVLLEGIAAGIVVAILFVLIGSGEPSIRPQPVDYAIWFAVLGFVGAFNSVAIYLINKLAIKIIGFANR